MDRYVSACLNTGTCATSLALKPAPRAVSFSSSRRHKNTRREARQFYKVKHLREQHVRGRVSSYAGGECRRWVCRRRLWTAPPLLSSRRKRFRRRRHTLLPRLRWLLFIAREILHVICVLRYARCTVVPGVFGTR